MKYVLLFLFAIAVCSNDVMAELTADSPVKFPKEGALPAKFPLDQQASGEIPEPGYYVTPSPERSLKQIEAIRAEMPAGNFNLPATDWTSLTRTRRVLSEGGSLKILALGDSIVADTMRSAWVANLRHSHPKTDITATVVVRGGGGCQHYKQEERVKKYIVARKPDLVLIGGISQQDIESMREVIDQIRAALPEVEILLFTGTFGTADPRVPEELEKAAHSGTGGYGRALKSLAQDKSCGYLDMTTPWAEYIRSSNLHPHMFYRDAVHANEFGEQVLSKILMAFWDDKSS